MIRLKDSKIQEQLKTSNNKINSNFIAHNQKGIDRQLANSHENLLVIFKFLMLQITFINHGNYFYSLQL